MREEWSGEAGQRASLDGHREPMAPEDCRPESVDSQWRARLAADGRWHLATRHRSSAYCSRSAFSGSTRDARHAGTQPAAIATAASISAETTYTPGSVRCTP